MENKNSKSINILLIEDNDGDVMLIQEALEEGKIVNKIEVINNGEKAIAYLKDVKEYRSKESPDLIILDVNLPKKDGHEVLKFIKTDEKLKVIPVIMLTTSSAEIDVLKSYKNHANCFITKPVEVDEFMNAVREIENFWFTIVRMP